MSGKKSAATPIKKAPKVAVVIPCYKVTQQIESVLKAIPDCVDFIYCVDDACPDASGATVKKLKTKLKDKRIKIITHDVNQGVGGAVVSGYKATIKDGAEIALKVDGDGQMDPALIPSFIAPIVAGECDYTKGNRFFRIDDVKAMPKIRLFGNAVLSFMTKLSSGYWTLFDPTNGYTAIHVSVLKELPLDKLARRYFFESDLLFRLNTVHAAVQDIPMRAVYEEEQSNLKISKIIGPFLCGHSRNFFKRIVYNYFLRDFNAASIELLLGMPLLLFGLIFGGLQWAESVQSGTVSSAGTVMLGALPIILGMQFILSFLNYDIRSVPTHPVHRKL